MSILLQNDKNCRVLSFASGLLILLSPTILQDVPSTDPNFTNIATIVQNNITVAGVNRAFNQWGDVTRYQYALFVERTIRLKEEIEIGKQRFYKGSRRLT